MRVKDYQAKHIGQLTAVSEGAAERVLALRANHVQRQESAENTFILTTAALNFDDETGAFMVRVSEPWLTAFDVYSRVFGETPDVLIRVGDETAVLATRELIEEHSS